MKFHKAKLPIVLGFCFVVCGLVAILDATSVGRVSRLLSPTTLLAAESAFTDNPACGTDPIRVLFAIANFGNKHPNYLENSVDALRDMCEAGLHIDLVVYKTLEDNFSADESMLLGSRAQCRNPVGSFQMRVEFVPKETGEKFAGPHRQMFFDNSDRYDLFVYTEDDILVRLQHVLAYLDETARIKFRVGEEDFFKFSLGFFRYENHPGTKRRTQWEHGVVFPTVDDPRFQGKYLSTSALSHHHQGMYMATKEQLQGWKDTCGCFRDPMGLPAPYFREYLSSICIFKTCGVTQLIPKESFQDFTVHHMPDKYLSIPKVAERASEGTLLNILVGSAKGETVTRGKNGLVMKFDM